MDIEYWGIDHWAKEGESLLLHIALSPRPSSYVAFLLNESNAFCTDIIYIFKSYTEYNSIYKESVPKFMSSDLVPALCCRPYWIWLFEKDKQDTVNCLSIVFGWTYGQKCHMFGWTYDIFAHTGNPVFLKVIM